MAFRNSTVKLNIGKIRSLNKAAVTALEKTGKALLLEVRQAQVMPRDKGTLQGEGSFVDYSQSEMGKVSLVTNTPYARRLYYHPELNFQTDDNPNARGKWLEPWMKGGEHEDFCQKAFARLYKGEAGV